MTKETKKRLKIDKHNIAEFLNTTAHKHNSFDFTAFSTMLSTGVNVSNIARAMNVDRRTVNHWISVLKS